jgi:hypothetical protein
MSSEEQVPSVIGGGAEQQTKKVPKKTEQAEEPLGEIRQRAMSAYAAYVEAERQVEQAYKSQEQQAGKNYQGAKQQTEKVCEESIAQALKIREEAEQKAKRVCEESIAQTLKIREEAAQKAWEARNEIMERTWAVFIKSRK